MLQVDRTRSTSARSEATCFAKHVDSHAISRLEWRMYVLRYDLTRVKPWRLTHVGVTYAAQTHAYV